MKFHEIFQRNGFEIFQNFRELFQNFRGIFKYFKVKYLIMHP